MAQGCLRARVQKAPMEPKGVLIQIKSSTQSRRPSSPAWRDRAAISPGSPIFSLQIELELFGFPLATPAPLVCRREQSGPVSGSPTQRTRCACGAATPSWRQSLNGRDFGDGDVHRAARAAASEILHGKDAENFKLGQAARNLDSTLLRGGWPAGPCPERGLARPTPGRWPTFRPSTR